MLLFILFLTFLIFSVCLYNVLLYYKCPNSLKIKGICYFDIDGTLTSSTGNREEIIKVCLDNNFAVGIITASGRKIEHICEGDKGLFDWPPRMTCQSLLKLIFFQISLMSERFVFQLFSGFV